jgi:hypothetical protein
MLTSTSRTDRHYGRIVLSLPGFIALRLDQPAVAQRPLPPGGCVFMSLPRPAGVEVPAC